MMSRQLKRVAYRGGLLGVVATVVCGAVAVAVGDHVHSSVAVPDRGSVESSFKAALLAGYPDAGPDPIAACYVEPNELSSFSVVCFGQIAAPDTEIHVVRGLAPARDPEDGPAIVDPADWPWELVDTGALPLGRSPIEISPGRGPGPISVRFGVAGSERPAVGEREFDCQLTMVDSNLLECEVSGDAVEVRFGVLGSNRPGFGEREFYCALSLFDSDVLECQAIE